MSAFRKIAIGTWQTAYDPSIYGTMRLRMDKAVDYIAQFREKTGLKLTATHLVTKAVALALKSCPDANAILRYNRIYLRENIDISLLVLIEDDGRIDLSAVKLEKVDELSLPDMVSRLDAHVAKIRARKDKVLEKTRKSMLKIPFLLINFFMKMIAFFAYTLNWNMKAFGIPKDAFGGAIVTSIGPLGLDIGYVPIVPYSRVPILVAPGAIQDSPIVDDDGELAIGKMMNLNATFDHRVVDGAHAAVMAKTIRQVFEDPFAALGPIDELDAPADPDGDLGAGSEQNEPDQGSSASEAS